MIISGRFANILKAGRSQFNARVAEAKHRYPSFEEVSFSEFLVHSVDPLIRSVDEIAPGNTTQVAVAAYDIALNLIGRDLATTGAAGDRMKLLWQQVFPSLALRIAENPVLTMGAMCNALVNMENIADGRPQQWLDLMCRHSPRAESSEDLLKTGVVAAWQSGAAHYRRAALNAAAQLPESLICNMMGIEKNIRIDLLLKNIDRNPWWLLQLQEKDASKLVKHIGKFSGFSGLFSSPPVVRADKDGFLVRSGEHYFSLIVDGFGTVFLSANKDEFENAHEFFLEGNEAKPQLKGNQVIYGEKTFETHLPAERLSMSFNANTIVLYSAYSFSLTIFPR